MGELVRLGELGTSTVLALALLIGLLMVGLFCFRVVPMLHRQAMKAFGDVTTAINTGTEEHRQARKADSVIAEQRHEEIMVTLAEIRRDFLSEDSAPNLDPNATAEHRPISIEIRRPQEVHA